MDAPASTSRLTPLRRVIRDLGSVVVCYSGGIDSALVLAVAAEELGDKAVGLTAVGPALPASERADAERIARDVGARHVFVESNEIERPGYVQNAPDRCFHCKTELYEIAESKRAEWGFAHVANGANLDDLGDYRPGLEAASLASVKSPLLEARFAKQDVRDAARELGLDVWDKPAAACLSSRIPYGSSVTRERLAQVEGLERDLKRLGFRQVRVRWHDTIARIEVGSGEFELLVKHREAIAETGKQHGFTYVTADLAGYRVGSHNDVLVGRGLKIVE
jgi:pyridinium-3,5-biscarboxylic acid mononucleotide sulfurtransferase